MAVSAGPARGYSKTLTPRALLLAYSQLDYRETTGLRLLISSPSESKTKALKTQHKFIVHSMIKSAKTTGAIRISCWDGTEWTTVKGVKYWNGEQWSSFAKIMAFNGQTWIKLT